MRNICREQVEPIVSIAREFPEAVKDKMGVALSVAQFGGKHPKAKPWKGEGSGVLEIVETIEGTRIARRTPAASFENLDLGVWRR